MLADPALFAPEATSAIHGESIGATLTQATWQAVFELVRLGELKI